MSNYDLGILDDIAHNYQTGSADDAVSVDSDYSLLSIDDLENREDLDPA